MTALCYYKHPGTAERVFPCFDQKATVCPACCLGECPTREPGWFRRCDEAGRPTWPAWMRAHFEQEMAKRRPAPRKLVCLETYWDDHGARMFGNRSVRPFFDALGAQLDPPLKLAHRFTDSMAQLEHYVSRPDGILWQDTEIFDTPIYYLSFHGSPGTVHAALDKIGPRTLCSAFADWGKGYDNLLYFGACSVLAGPQGRRFARDFLAASRCRAIVGYATDVDWIDSMVIDLLFLRRFFRDRDPWKNLRAIFESVLADVSLAARLGYSLCEPRDFGIEVPQDGKPG